MANCQSKAGDILRTALHKSVTLYAREKDKRMRKIFTYFLHPEAGRPAPHPRAPAIHDTLQNRTNTIMDSNAMTNRDARENAISFSLDCTFSRSVRNLKNEINV